MGGENGFKGYSYQTLAFLNEMLKDDSIKGQLEKEDDFYIEKERGIKICAQAKDISKVVGKTEIKTFANNFIKSYLSGNSNNFLIISPFGVSKTIDIKEIFLEIGKDKINDDQLTKLISSLQIIKMTREHLISEICLKIGDNIKDDGGSIKTKDISKIIEQIMGQFFIEQKEIKSKELVQAIKLSGKPYIVDIPEGDIDNASDLMTKYFEKKLVSQSNRGLKCAVNFCKRSRRSLIPNPTLSQKFQLLISNVIQDIKSKNIESLNFDEFKKIFNSELQKSEGDLKEFVEANKDILEEIYNKLIEVCIYYPK